VSTVTIYRHFLKALRHYPSVKQPQYIIACREGERDPLQPAPGQRLGQLPESLPASPSPCPAPAQPQPSPSPAPAQLSLAQPSPI
jgi:hypothetical protein